MEGKRQPDNRLRLMFWNSELRRMDRDRVYDRKLESLVLAVQQQHGLKSEPRKIYFKEGPPNLTHTMMKLIEGYKLALFCELADIRSPPLPSGLLPLLVGLVPEDRLSAMLTDLRAMAVRLHEEDVTPTMQVTRFFARLRDSGRSC